MFGWLKKRKETPPPLPDIKPPIQAMLDSVVNEPNRWSFTTKTYRNGSYHVLDRGVVRTTKLQDTKSGFYFETTERYSNFLDSPEPILDWPGSMILTSDEASALIDCLNRKMAEKRAKDEEEDYKRRMVIEEGRRKRDKESREELSKFFK